MFEKRQKERVWSTETNENQIKINVNRQINSKKKNRIIFRHDNLMKQGKKRQIVVEFDSEKPKKIISFSNYCAQSNPKSILMRKFDKNREHNGKILTTKHNDERVVC